MLVKRNARKAQKIVLKVVQVPGDGLAIEARGGITDAVVQIAGGFDLEEREDGNDFAVGFHHRGSDVFAGAILTEKFEQSSIAKVFFKISAVVEVLGVDFRNRQAVPAKMPGEGEEGDILFAAAVKNANRGDAVVGKADDFAARAAEFTLQRLNARGRCVEMLLEKGLKNIQGHSSSHRSQKDGSGRAASSIAHSDSGSLCGCPWLCLEVQIDSSRRVFSGGSL